MMRMKSMLVLAVLAALVAAPAVGLADAADLLKHVPSDAHVVIVAPSFKDLSDKVVDYAQKFGVRDQLPETGLQGTLAEESGIDLGQFDVAGAAAIVIPQLPEDQNSEPAAAAFLPIKDYAAFKTANKVETKAGQEVFTDSEGDVMYVANVGSYVLLSKDAALVKKLSAVTNPMTLTAEQQSLLKDAQMFVQINAAAVFSMMRQQLEKDLADPEQQANVKMFGELLQVIGKDAASLSAAVVMQDSGVELRGMLLAKKDSPMAKAFSSAGKPAGALVAGVPVDAYMLLFGAANTLDLDNEFVRRLSDVSTRMTGQQINNLELANTVNQKAVALAKLVKRKSMSLVGTPVNGRMGTPMTVFVNLETTDGDKALAMARDYMTDYAKLINMMLPAQPAAEGEKPAPPVAFSQAAEKVGGVDVDHMSLSQQALAQFAGPAAMMIPQFLGEQSITLRMARKGNNLVFTLGGGAAAVEKAFAAVDQVKAVNELPGVAKVQSHLTPNASGVVYYAVDQFADMVIGVVGMMMGAPMPAFPKVDEPVTLSYAFDGPAVRARLFVPMSLMQGVRKYIDQMQNVGGGSPNGAAPAPAPESDF